MKRAIILILLTAACQPAGPSSPAAGSRPPSSHYAALPGRGGGTLVMGDWEYPATLDPVHATTETELRIAGVLFAPLWGTDPDLVPYPDLVQQVPSLANGGVKVGRDGASMAVDVKLLPGLHWSDGAPITSDDVIFTVNSICSPSSPGRDRSGFDQIASQERRSESEVIWHFGPRPKGSCGLPVDTSTGLYPAIQLLGPRLLVLPSHLLAGVAESTWPGLPFFSHPEATSGPFSFRGRVGSQLIDLSPNPHRADGRAAAASPPGGPLRFDRPPRLSGLTLRFFTGRAAEIAALQEGEVDIGFHLLPSDIAELSALPSSRTIVTPTLQLESLHPNHGTNAETGLAPPWAGDGPVLAALDLSLDRQALDDAAFAGAARPASGLFPSLISSFAQPAPRGPRRSLDAARRALDEDGWKPAAGGLREKGGRRLEFSLLAPCLSAPRAAETAELLRQWAEIGARAIATCSPAEQLFAGYPAGILSRGAFDMALYSYGFGPDPSAWAPFGETGEIPNATVPQGRNWDRCSDARLADALARGGGSLDPGQRSRAYGEAAAEWQSYRCSIPLLQWPSVVERSGRVLNFHPNPGWVDTWNAADWGY